MTWTVSASGTQTAVISTEHILQTDTVNGTYYYEVDISAMVLGDILELRVYVMTLAAGTLRQAWKTTIGPQVAANASVPSPAQPSDQSYKATLKQTAGTGRAFPWKVLRI